MYKFLQSVYPKQFQPFLKPRHRVYNICKNQADGELLEDPGFATSVYISLQSIFASYDAPQIWNDLPDVCLATPFPSFRKKLKTFSLQKHTHHNFCIFVVFLHGADPLYLSG